MSAYFATVQSFTIILKFVIIAPVMTNSLIQHCGNNVQVQFSAYNGTSQEISCCMEDPSQCRWVGAGGVNTNYRVEETGLILNWIPNNDTFRRYSCLNQINGTEEEVNFLPMEGLSL